MQQLQVQFLGLIIQTQLFVTADLFQRLMDFTVNNQRYANDCFGLPMRLGVV